jgi:hypothetical protein
MADSPRREAFEGEREMGESAAYVMGSTDSELDRLLLQCEELPPEAFACWRRFLSSRDGRPSTLVVARSGSLTSSRSVLVPLGESSVSSESVGSSKWRVRSWPDAD